MGFLEPSRVAVARWQVLRVLAGELSIVRSDGGGGHKAGTRGSPCR